MEHLRKRKSTKPATRTPVPLPSGHSARRNSRYWATYDVLNMYYLMVQVEDTDFAIIARVLQVHDTNECKSRFQNDQKLFYSGKKSPAPSVIFYSMALDYMAFAEGIAVTPDKARELKARVLALMQEAADHVRYDIDEQFVHTPWWSTWLKNVRELYSDNFLPNLGGLEQDAIE